MKKEDKKFLRDSNPNLENQECHVREMVSVLRLYTKEYIKKLEVRPINGSFDEVYCLFYLTKKGVKKVNKLQK